MSAEDEGIGYWWAALEAAASQVVPRVPRVSLVAPQRAGQEDWQLRIEAALSQAALWLSSDEARSGHSATRHIERRQGPPSRRSVDWGATGFARQTRSRSRRLARQ